MKNQIVSLALLIYLMLSLSLPLLRHRWTQGEWPVAFQREANPFQRLMGALLALLLLAGFGWAVLLATVAGERLGILQGPVWTEWLGWLLVAAGASLEVAGQLAMGASFRVGIDDRPTALVTGGVFRVLRNPVFTGVLMALSGFVCLAPSAWSVMGLLWFASLIAIQVRLEEAHLLGIHGEPYALYAGRVGRFLPGLGKLRPGMASRRDARPRPRSAQAQASG